MEIEVKIPDGTVEELANRVLDEFEYNGKTIRQWANSVANPKTNADRIRAMSDEELAFYIVNHPMWSDESACVAWLKEPITEGESENPN